MKGLVYHRYLLPASERFAGKVGFHDGDHRVTYAVHLDRVLRLTDALRRQLRLRGDSRFAVLAGNGHRYLELYHAAFLGAGVITPLNLRLAPPELAFVLQDSGAEVVFADALFAQVVATVRDRVPSVRAVVDMSAGEYERLLASGEAVVPAEPEEEDAVLLSYTGGTTGLPKGVVIQQRAAMIGLHHMTEVMGIVSERVYVHTAPMFHQAGIGAALGVPAAGGTSVFVAAFDPGVLLDTIESHRADTLTLVPTMIAMLLDHAAFRPERMRSVRTIAYGASPMPDPLLRRLLDLFPDVELVQGYGMTETFGVVAALAGGDHRAGRLDSVGRPLLGVHLVIQDQEGHTLPAEQTGEVCLRTAKLMRGYWKRPEETAEAFRGGWYHTGDAGFLDADGYVHVVDRVKDMIITGGENVYSTEVESAIASHPGVAQVAVIGVPHDTWGEAVHAIVVPMPGATLTEHELVSHARERIAGYKVPKSIDVRDAPLPLSAVGKPLKRELRQPFWQGRERSI